MRRRSASLTPGTPQLYTLKLEPTLFVTGLRCSSACDPESYNPVRFPLPVRVDALRGKLSVTDTTEAGTDTALEREARPPELRAVLHAADIAPGAAVRIAFDRNAPHRMEDA